MSYEVDIELLNSVFNYLTTKPYIEVFKIIKDLETKPKLIEAQVAQSPPIVTTEKSPKSKGP